MSRAKVGITLEQETLSRLDRLVKEHRFPSRSRAIQELLSERLEGLERRRLARESLRLDASFEKLLAEEGLSTSPYY